jgi:hypothetical protein
MSLNKTASVIKNAAASIWPEVNHEVELRPLVDLSLGDVGTDYFLKLANLLKLDPEIVGQRVMQEAGRQCALDWNIENGFLNLKLPDSDLMSITGKPVKTADCEYIILLQPAIRQLSSWDLLRLSSLALVQMSVLRSLNLSVELFIGEQKVCCQREEQDFITDVFRAIIEERYSKDSVDGIRSEFEKVLDANRDKKTFIWLTPRFFPRRRFVSFFKAKLNDNPGIILRCPEQKWLSAKEYDLEPDSLLHWSSPAILSLIVYLAGGTAAEDLDLQVPLLNEKDNLFWYLSSTRQRIHTVLGNSPLADRSSSSDGGQNGSQGAGCDAALSELERAVLLRVKFLEYFYYNAGLHGEVRDFIDVFKGLLSSFNRLFNDPAFRLRCDSYQFSSNEFQIMTGATDVLSDIIESWEMVRY